MDIAELGDFLLLFDLNFVFLAYAIFIMLVFIGRVVDSLLVVITILSAMSLGDFRRSGRVHIIISLAVVGVRLEILVLASWLLWILLVSSSGKIISVSILLILLLRLLVILLTLVILWLISEG